MSTASAPSRYGTKWLQSTYLFPCVPLCSGSRPYVCLQTTGITHRGFGFTHEACCVLQLAALEIVAKSRTQGTVRAHLTRQIGMDARNFHYITQVSPSASGSIAGSRSSPKCILASAVSSVVHLPVNVGFDQTTILLLQYLLILYEILLDFCPVMLGTSHLPWHLLAISDVCGRCYGCHDLFVLAQVPGACLVRSALRYGACIVSNNQQSCCSTAQSH